MIDCEDMIRKAFNKNVLSNEDVEEVIRQARKLKQRMEAQNKGPGMTADLDAMIKQKVATNTLEAYAKKRNALLQINARSNLLGYCLSSFKGMEAEGLYAKLAGSKFAEEGARNSVDAIGRSMAGHYIGGLIYDLEALGNGEFGILKSGAMDRDICEALWLVKKPEEYKGPAVAMKIAEVIHKWSEKARINENHAGAWINELPGFIVKQSHDPAKLRKFGYEEWRDYVNEHLDWERTLDGDIDPVAEPERAEAFLRSVYDSLETGYHMKTDNSNTNPVAHASIIGGTAAKDSHSRLLHFKDGGAWFDYHQKWGRGNLSEAILHGLNHAAQSTALMQNFGPSPQATMNWVITELKNTLRRQGDNDGVKRVMRMESKINNQMKVLDGTENIEGNPSLGEISRNIRSIESMSKLGGATLSAIADVPNFASEFAYQGRNYFGAMAEGLQQFVKGRGSKEEQLILSQCGVFFDGMAGEISARFNGGDLPGKMTAMQNVFFKMSGLTWWTDTWKKAATLMMSHDLAQERHLSWGNLTKARQRVLGLYGIDAERWDLMRKQATVAADGREYLTPEMANQISKADLADFVQKQGREVSEGSLMAAREEIQNQFRSYFRDRVQFAVLEPDAANRRLLHGGTSAGTLGGEVLRFMTQFKAFPTGFIQRTMAREIYGRGARSIRQGLGQEFSLASNASGERGNFFKLFIMMTAFGYLAMTAKQLAANKTPRELSWKTLLAAAVQGGGMGFYGDFLFGEASRTGSRPIASMMGPVASDLDSLARTLYRTRDKIIAGDENWKDVGMDLSRFGIAHIPFNNLFYLKGGLDYLLNHTLYEGLRPGYYKRYRQRIAKENGQTFLFD